MVVSPIIIEFNLSNKLYFDSVVLDLPGLPMKGHVHLLKQVLQFTQMRLRVCILCCITAVIYLPFRKHFPRRRKGRTSLFFHSHL